jgi:hypothetical protein
MAASDIESCGIDIEIDVLDIEMPGLVIGFKERWRLANFCQMGGDAWLLNDKDTPFSSSMRSKAG